jgi:hypothetical protein
MVGRKCRSVVGERADRGSSSLDAMTASCRLDQKEPTMSISALSASTAAFSSFQTATVSPAQPTQNSAPAQPDQATQEVNAGHDGDADDGGARMPAGAVSSPSQAQAAYDAHAA